MNRQATQKKTAIADQQERAGAVVRSYYMGDRDNLLVAFFSAKSISRFLALFDYYEIIIGNDRDILSQYEEQYKDLKDTIQTAKRNSEELARLRTALEEQQVRVNALNKEIEGGIKNSSDPENMSTLLKEFTLYWENIYSARGKNIFQGVILRNE